MGSASNARMPVGFLVANRTPVHDKRLWNASVPPRILAQASGARRPQRVQGDIAMQRGQKTTHLPSMEMPARLDPCGVPCVDPGHGHGRATSHRRHGRSLPGLAPKSLIATVEDVAEVGEANWLVWGSVDNRPVLFSVAAAGAAEMMHTVGTGETATAIIEPWQLVLERLD